jgi:hypothetical protein
MSSASRWSRQLQRALDGRLRALRRKLHLPHTADEEECDADIVEQQAALEFEVEDVTCARVSLASGESVHAIPSWMLPSESASSPVTSTISLRSLHPSREFANAHLEARSAAAVEVDVRESRFWLEKRSWSLRNYSVDAPPIEVAEVCICCAAQEEGDEDIDALSSRLHFSTPLFQSIRLPGELTLHHRLTLDEQESQIAFHTADEEQQSYLQLLTPAERNSVRRVNESEYQRWMESTAFVDETLDSTLGPVTLQLLPCFARILHRYALPLTLQTVSFFHALTGFQFLNHLLLQSSAVHQLLRQSLFDPTHGEKVRQQFEQHMHHILWPDVSADSNTMCVSAYCLASDLPSINSSAAASLDDADDEDVPMPSSRFSRMANDARSFVDDSPSAAAVPTASATPMTAAAPLVPSLSAASSTSVPPAVLTLTGLIISYLYMSEWILEFDLAAPSTTASTASSSASKKRPHAKHGKGKSKGKK